MVADVLTWVGLGRLAPLVPLPNLPVPSFIEGFWLGVRQFVRGTSNHKPTATPTLSEPDPETGAIGGDIHATDPDGDELTYAGTSSTTHGDVVVDQDGTFLYTPHADDRHAAAAGAGGVQDSFTITVSDGHGGTLDVPVSVAVSPRNAKPGAVAVDVESPDVTSGEVTGSITATDTDHDILTYTVSAQPIRAQQLDFDSTTGSFTYTPTDDAMKAAADGGPESDTFTVTITDAHGGTTTSDVTVAVTAWSANINRAPRQTAAATVVPPDSAGAVAGRINVIDPDGDDLVYTIAPLGDSRVEDGAFQIDDATGEWTFRPTADRMHEAAATTGRPDSYSFRWTSDDGRGGTLQGDITVPVAPANQKPTIQVSDDKQRDTLTGDITAIFTATDSDADWLTASVKTSDPTLGTATVEWIGGSKFRWRYTPAAGADPAAWQTVTIIVADDHGGIRGSQTSVQPSAVTASAAQPPSTGQTTTKPSDPNTGAITGTVSIANPPAGVTYSASGGTKGSITVDPISGDFTYTPAPHSRTDAARADAGPDALTDTVDVTVTNLAGDIVDTFRITVPISPLNRPPTTSVQVTDHNAYTGVVKGHVTGVDPDGDSLRYTGSGDTALGHVVINSVDGSFVYTPTLAARILAAEQADVRDVFWVTIQEANGRNTIQPVSVTIMPVIIADPPDDPTVPPSNPGPGKPATINDLVRAPGFLAWQPGAEGSAGSGSNYGETDHDFSGRLDGYDVTGTIETEHAAGNTFGGWPADLYDVHSIYKRYVQQVKFTAGQPADGTEQYLITWANDASSGELEAYVTSVTLLRPGTEYTAQDVLQLRDYEHVVGCNYGGDCPFPNGTYSEATIEGALWAGHPWDQDDWAHHYYYENDASIVLGRIAGATIYTFQAGTFPTELFPISGPLDPFDPTFEVPLQHLQETGWDLQRSFCYNHDSLKAAQFLVYHRPTGNPSGRIGFVLKRIPGVFDRSTHDDFKSAYDDVDASWQSCSGIPSDGDNDN